MTNIKFYGDSELLQRLENAGHNVTEACAAALQEGLATFGRELVDEWHGIPKHPTGRTEKSYREEVKINGDKVVGKAGFSIKDGGLPALFFNLGYNKGHKGFISDVRARSLDAVKKAELEVLKGLLNVE